MDQGVKQHYKMYKSGKRWLFAGVATFATTVGIVAGGNLASADVTTTTSEEQTANSTSGVDMSANTVKFKKGGNTQEHVTDTSTLNKTSPKVITNVVKDVKQAVQASNVTSLTKDEDIHANEAEQTQPTTPEEKTEKVGNVSTATPDTSVKAPKVQVTEPQQKVQTFNNKNQTSKNVEKTGTVKQHAKVVQLATANGQPTSSSTKNISTTKPTDTRVKKSNLVLAAKNTQDVHGLDSNASNMQDAFRINGDAKWNSQQGIVDLTPNEKNKVGNITLKTQIDMTRDFQIKGAINLGDKKQKHAANGVQLPGGADGISFGFHDGGLNSVGKPGGAMGVGGLKADNAFGWKADTFWNNAGDTNGKWFDDPDPAYVKNKSFGAMLQGNGKANDGRLVSKQYGAKTIADPTKNEFKDITFSYTGSTHKMKIEYDGQIWAYIVSTDGVHMPDAMSFFISASTGDSCNLQQFRLDEFRYGIAGRSETRDLTRTINYIDKQTGATISKQIVQDGKQVRQSITDNMTGRTLGYDTNGDGQVDTTDGDKAWISLQSWDEVRHPDLSKKGYDAPKTQDGKNFSSSPRVELDTSHSNNVVENVYYDHTTTPFTPDHPGTPGEPLNPSNPEGPSVPKEAAKDQLNRQVTRTINYLDKKTGKVVSKQVQQTVDFGRTVIVDKITGEVLGYDTNGDGQVDTTDANAAWRQLGGNWNSVVSPDLSKQGYGNPSLGKTTAEQVNAATKDTVVNVYYDHATTPFTPDHPGTPGEPLNPSNPEGPGVPKEAAKDQLNRQVTRTINYLDKKTGKVVSKQVQQTVDFGRTVIVDKITGEVLGYDTNGDGQVDTTDANAAWRQLGGDWNSVVSPDLSKQGYGNPSLGKTTAEQVNADTKDTVVNVYYDHATTPFTPDHPGTPGEPLNPSNPEGPGVPKEAAKDQLNRQVTRTINYLDKKTGKVVSKQVQQTVDFGRTVIVDKITGEVLGYDTNGDGQVDTTDANAAWRQLGGNWNSVVSPDLSKQGYGNPSLGKTTAEQVNAATKDTVVNVYYDHATTPDTPSNPTTPGEPNHPGTPDTPSNPTTPGEPNHPGTPDTPSNPTTPGEPNHPGTPDTPSNPTTPGEPTTPSHPDSAKTIITSTQTTTTGKVSHSDNTKLPNTGENDQSILSIMGSTLFALLGLIGWRRSKSK